MKTIEELRQEVKDTPHEPTECDDMNMETLECPHRNCVHNLGGKCLPSPNFY